LLLEFKVFHFFFYRSSPCTEYSCWTRVQSTGDLSWICPSLSSERSCEAGTSYAGISMSRLPSTHCLAI